MVNWAVLPQRWTCGQLRKWARAPLLLRLTCKALQLLLKLVSVERSLGHTKGGTQAITSSWRVRGVLVSKTNMEDGSVEKLPLGKMAMGLQGSGPLSSSQRTTWVLSSYFLFFCLNSSYIEKGIHWVSAKFVAKCRSSCFSAINSAN